MPDRTPPTRTLPILITAAIVTIACTFWAAPSVSADAQSTAFAQQVKAAMNPADQAWLRAEAGATRKASRVDTTAIGSRVNARFAGRTHDSRTLEVIMMAVLAEVEQRARSDMQALAAVIEASNRQKEALRELMDLLGDSGCSDSVGQQAATELQKATQQASEAARLASSISKKHHSAMQQIIGNIRG